ncbi:MAG: hypothetical protein COA63_012790 [Methylophaga sp.]|nr:hypothetical protein [Methylophaga sp.]
MRIEFNGLVLLICIVLLALVWLLGRRHRSKPYFVFILSFCGALLLPAFIPGHGEIIIALPNAALFTVFNSLAWAAGLFYLVINFFISYAVLNGLQRYQDLK